MRTTGEDLATIASDAAAPLTLAELEERLRSAGHKVTIGRCTDLRGAAAFMGKAPRTVRDWVQASRGPTPIRYPSGALYFPLENLLAWRAAQEGFDAECRSRRNDAVSGGKRVA